MPRAYLLLKCSIALDERCNSKQCLGRGRFWGIISQYALGYVIFQNACHCIGHINSTCD